MMQPRRTLLHHTQPLSSAVCQICFFDLTLEQGKDEDNTITREMFYQEQLKTAHSKGLCYVCCFLIASLNE
jgi:hypothetical protein